MFLSTKVHVLYLLKIFHGSAGVDRTLESGSQSPLPYRLATALYSLVAAALRTQASKPLIKSDVDISLLKATLYSATFNSHLSGG